MYNVSGDSAVFRSLHEVMTFSQFVLKFQIASTSSLVFLDIPMNECSVRRVDDKNDVSQIQRLTPIQFSTVGERKHSIVTIN